MQAGARQPSGHVFLVQRVRGPVWYGKYRLADGRQVQKKLGPAWNERGRAPSGYFTRRIAEAWLRDVLDQGRQGTLGKARPGATFADAAHEWLRYTAEDRGRKPSTLADYRSIVSVHLIPEFGDEPLERVDTQMIERWLSRLLAEDALSGRSLQKLVVALNGIFRRARKVWRLPHNPVSDVERFAAPKRTELAFFTPEEIHSLARAAASEQDASLFVTAAFTGLRMGELLALRWRDVDFFAQTVRVTASLTAGRLGTPASGHGRAVPLVNEVGDSLARLSHRRRWTDPDDLVFVGQAGRYLDGSALRRRYKQAREAAGLRALRFDDLRHTSAAAPLSDVSGAWEENADQWVAWARAPRHDVYYWDLNLPAFAELVPAAGRRALDVGCGEGRIGRWLASRGDCVAGIDLSQTLADRAREAGGYEQVVCGDAASLPWPAGEFDLAVAFMSLHDMPHPAAVITELARVLKRGAVLCIAIVHPLNRSAAHWEDYFGEQQFTESAVRNGLKMSFVGIDRPLESYTRPLAANGFLIEELREPRASAAAVASAPELAPAAKRPYFLHLRCRLSDR